jgi:L-alanine-DL-glutamate epimerase-like enolase superfamily enzyme
MKIVDIRIDRAQIELDPPFLPNWDPQPRRTFAATLVSVVTDEGITGYGSGDSMEGFESYAHLFIGQPLLNIQQHVRTLETITFHGGRYWPLEAAIWDAIGKNLNQPVATLFGGALEAIPAYASTAAIMQPRERAESAVAIAEAGFPAIKIRVSQSDLDRGVETIQRVRDAVGDRLEIMIDLNQAWRMPGDIRASLDPVAVRRFADACRDFNIFWLEEPLPVADIEGLHQLRSSGIRIAGGEMVRSVPELLDLLDADALDVYQPDVVLAVGLERSRLIAGLAHARNRLFTPHTWSNGYGLAANLQVTAGLGGGPFIEFPYDPPTWTEERRDFMLTEPMRIAPDGTLRVPDAPGLGVAPNLDVFGIKS